MASSEAVQPIRLYGLLDEGPVRVRLLGDHHDFESLYEGEALGVYTAFRTFDHNRFLDLTSHLRRLRASMGRFGMSRELNVDRLRLALHEVCTAYPGADSRVRIDVLAAPAQFIGLSAQEFIALAPFTPPGRKKYEKGVSVATTRSLERSDPLTKTADFATHRKAVMGRFAWFEDCLLVSSNQEFLEGCSSNFYAINDGALYTAGQGVLEGVARGIVLQLARRLGIPIRLDASTVDMLPVISEAAISSSSRGLMPVTSIDGIAVGDGHVGPVISQLQRAYDEHIRESVRPAIDS